MLYAVIAISIFIYTLWKYKSSTSHEGRPLTGAGLISKIKNLVEIIGVHDVEHTLHAMETYCALPSVYGRNKLLNHVSSWQLRHCDTPDTFAEFIKELVDDLDDWTLSMLSPEQTRYDMPRPHNFTCLNGESPFHQLYV